MEQDTQINLWLLSEFKDSKKDQFIPAREIKECMRARFPSVSDSNVGTYIRHAFPNITSQAVRRKDDWTQKHVVYQGIEKIYHMASHLQQFEFMDIQNKVPNDFFVLTKSDTNIVVGKDTGLVCYGNRVITEISISIKGSVSIKMCGKIIPTNRAGIPDNIALNNKSLNTLFSSVRSICLCQGLEMKENINMINCSMVMPIRRLRSLLYCKGCRQQLSTPQTNNLKQTPISDISNTSNIQKVHDKHDKSGTDLVHPQTHVTEKVAPMPHEKGETITCLTSHETDCISKLRAIAPNLSEASIHLIESQIHNSNVENVQGRRWSDDMIQICISTWSRSPKAYEELSKTGALLLPSTKTLSTYKNSVKQQAGIVEDQFKWMYMDAKHKELPPQGYHGGLILDEMAIQDDLQIHDKKLIGLPNLGVEGNVMQSGNCQQLANHVLQYVFLGFTGFRFLVAHFPTRQANAPQIFSSFWDVVAALQRWGFHVEYTCLDGASTNRNFIKMHFTASPLDHHMACTNPFSGTSVILLPDPSHIFKKIRNNILKSGPEKWHTRLLEKDGHKILWLSWLKCYTWDQRHGLAIHQKLTHDHLYPNQADKMRNHLAEEVLNSDMLNLMERYVEYHPDAASDFTGPTELLKQTSLMISIFHDRRAIYDTADPRLHQLHSVLEWFKSWESSSKAHNLMSWESHEDIKFLLTGFPKLCEKSHYLKHNIVPLYINSDIIENVFSQQRGTHHGAGNNPNYLQYCYATNSITIGQSTISKKANASRRKCSKDSGSVPFKQLCKEMRL